MQVIGKTSREEQSVFGTEALPDQPLLKRPVAVPDAVSEILKRDDGVKSCLENNPLPPGQPLSSWFIASRIHLGGPNETDLVVLGNPEPGDSYPCFYTPSGLGWFWVFRQGAGQPELILKAIGNGLEVLKTRHGAHKDIQTMSIGQAGRYVTTVTFHFDGKRYRQSRESTQKAH